MEREGGRTHMVVQSWSLWRTWGYSAILRLHVASAPKYVCERFEVQGSAAKPAYPTVWTVTCAHLTGCVDLKSFWSIDTNRPQPWGGAATRAGGCPN